MLGKIIVFEGPDCSGKTTLIEKLISEIGGVRIHNSWYKGCDIIALQQQSIDKAISEKNKGHNVFIDRLWLSEIIYGLVFRQKSEYENNIDKIIEFESVIDFNIFCFPGLPRFVIKSHRKLSKVRDEMYSDISEVVHKYYNGNWGINEKYNDLFIHAIFTKNSKCQLYDFLQENSYSKIKQFILNKGI